MSGPIVEMLVVQSWNSHNILSFDQLFSTVSGDSSSVIKHKLGFGSIKQTVVCGFQAYPEVTQRIRLSLHYSLTGFHLTRWAQVSQINDNIKQAKFQTYLTQLF